MIPDTITHFNNEYELKPVKYTIEYPAPDPYTEDGFKFLVGTQSEHTTLLTEYGETSATGTTLLNVMRVELDGEVVPITDIDGEYCMEKLVQLHEPSTGRFGFLVYLSSEYVETEVVNMEARNSR